MINRVILEGRLTRDPELRYNPSGVAITTFTLAVDRTFKNGNGEREADFIRVIAWRQLAEICANNLKKGRLISVEGRWQTGSYENNGGQRVYTNDCVIDSMHFLDRSDSNQSDNQSSGFKRNESDPFSDDGKPIDISDADLPF